MRKILLFLGMTGLSFCGLAQSVFWTETFGTGCDQGQMASGLNPTGNGPWTVTSTGSNDPYANEWFISATEAGMGIGNCGDGCLGAGGTNRTLHIGAYLPPLTIVDVGAAYSVGAGTSNTDKRVESPLINCSGQSSVTLSFAYFVNGIPGSDYAELLYSPNGGATWTVISTPPQTANVCSGQGLWTSYTIALPSSANNNPNVKIGFRWQNVSSSGNDPSIAVDDIQLSGTPASSSFTVAFTSTASVCAGTSFTASAYSGTTAVTGYTWTSTPAGALISAPNASSTAMSFSASGTYTINLLASSGSATAAASNTISVSPQPTVYVASSPSTALCSGNSAVLTATGASSYVWQPGGATGFIISVSPTVTTLYTVTATGFNGCTITAVQQVSVNPAPTLSITSSSGTICAGQTASLAAYGASNYTWSTGATVYSIAVSPTVNTTYTVTGTNSYGCSSGASYTENVSTCIGINEISGDEVFRVYPNPVSDKLFIEQDVISGAIEIEITDALGRCIIKESVTGNEKTCINTSSLQPGTYFLRINNGDGQKIIKVMKE